MLTDKGQISFIIQDITWFWGVFLCEIYIKINIIKI